MPKGSSDFLCTLALAEVRLPVTTDTCCGPQAMELPVTGDLLCLLNSMVFWGHLKTVLLQGAFNIFTHLKVCTIYLSNYLLLICCYIQASNLYLSA